MNRITENALPEAQGLWKVACQLRGALALLVAALLLGTPAWGHDGSDHSNDQGKAGARSWAALTPQGPVATEVTGLSEDEARTRRYFTDLPLRNQDGEVVRFYSDVLRNRVVLINFVYTNCESGCPVATRQLAGVIDLLGERFGKEVFFVSLSTDAERDTPEALKAFALENGVDRPGWIFLTGDKADMDLIIHKLGQFNPDPEMHSMQLLAGNVPARHWVKLRPNAPVPALAYRLNQLADELATVTE